MTIEKSNYFGEKKQNGDHDQIMLEISDGFSLVWVPLLKWLELLNWSKWIIEIID